MSSGLNRKLKEACENGDLNAVHDLLVQGAEINSGEIPLIWAAYKGHADIVEVLIEAGADKNISDQNRKPVDWARQSGHTAVVEVLERPFDTSQVIYRQMLSDRMMEEIFNFRTLERIVLLRNGVRGAVEAMTSMPFSKVPDQERLREAFEKHCRRGGKTDEIRVFPNKINKAALRKPP